MPNAAEILERESDGAAPSGQSRSLLVRGRNCWRIERASRLSFLVDGCAYFSAVRAAMARAQHSIFIIGWDIDSRIRLASSDASDRQPETLTEFLNALVAGRRGLRIYVLSWDYAMLYALEREWLSVFKLDRLTHRRLSFRLDGHHPTWASHHQKIVVVDDAVAWVGGLDLTRSRWDTPEHRPDDPRRRDPGGDLYGPFHDVEAMFDGAAARALGELARERWWRSTGKRARSVNVSPGEHPWPEQFAPDLADVDVAIARSEPQFDGHPGATEIRQCYLDAIAAARRHIYIENQYFSAKAVAEALAARLGESAGPEVVVVGSRKTSGWLEEASMGAMRAHLHHRLREADSNGRYRPYCPELPGRAEPGLNVHSKLLIVDDEVLTVGSANLNNRSMGVDTECNIAIEARGDERVRRAIAGLRNRLLGEHLGADPAEVGARTARASSLVAAIEALRGGERTLDPFEPEAAPEPGDLLLDPAVVDPERPVDADILVGEYVPVEAKWPLLSRIWGKALIAVMLVGLAAAWHWTPLHDWVDVPSLIDSAGNLQHAAFTPFAVIGIYLIAGLMVVPVMVLIGATGIVFGPLVGAAYGLAGASLSAALTYWVGRWLGRDFVRRFAGGALNRVSQRVGRHGLLAIIVVRMLPIAPFTVVNVIAGASHINFRNFMLGTIIGLAPGIVVTVVFVDRIVAALKHPSAETFALLGAVAAVVIAAAAIVRRWLRDPQPRTDERR